MTDATDVLRGRETLRELVARMLSAGLIDQAVAAELLSVDAAQAAASPVGPRNLPARSALVEYLPDGQFRLVRTGKVWTVEELIIGDEWEQQGGHHQCKRDALVYIDRVRNPRQFTVRHGAAATVGTPGVDFTVRPGLAGAIRLIARTDTTSFCATLTPAAAADLAAELTGAIL
ncbi:hypothetical protein [Prescottella equi]|uniref:hypothetical protein n=1 Tax=Rhodococcus hoagii TaxID=43767 RepID=UPI000A7984E9|nr:hypothetical protein [Prescottella equi]